jgi:hypothetical protein
VVPLHDRAHRARSHHHHAVDQRDATGRTTDTHPATPAADDAGAVLRDTVERLRDEVEGLQRSKDHRAVIEQAKGVLMERHGVDAPTAFAQLRRQARDSNRRLVDVAAETLALRGAGAVRTAASTVPDVPPLDSAESRGGLSPDATARDTRTGAETADRPDQPDRPRTSRPTPSAPTSVRHDPLLVPLEAAAAQAGSLQGLAEVLCRLCRFPPGADRAVVLSISADSSVSVAAYSGLPADVVTRWRHVPLSVDFPAAYTARTGIPVFEDDVEAMVQRWPVLAGDSRVGTFCNVPVTAEGSVVAVVGFGWPSGTRLSGHDRLLLRAAVRLVTPDLLRLLPRSEVQAVLADGGGPEDLGLHLALDAVAQESVLLLPRLPQVEGRGPDLVLAWANTAALEAAAVAGDGHRFGRPLSESAPHLVGGELWRTCLQALQERGPGTVVTTDEWFWGTTGRRAVVRPLYHGVLVVERP